MAAAEHAGRTSVRRVEPPPAREGGPGGADAVQRYSIRAARKAAWATARTLSSPHKAQPIPARPLVSRTSTSTARSPSITSSATLPSLSEGLTVSSVA